MPEQGNKYNILHIKDLLEAIFFRNVLSKQISFNLSAKELHDKRSASISFEIIPFEHLQQVSYEKLNRRIFLQEYVQPNTSQIATMIALWKIITVFRSSSWNFSSPHYLKYFVCQSVQKFMEKKTSKVPFREIKWENIHFCGFKKETLFLMRGKCMETLQKKYVKFFTSGYYFPLYISPLT